MADSKYGTPYIESELILAAQAEDAPYVTEKLKGMTDHELAQLLQASVLLADEIKLEALDRLRTWRRDDAARQEAEARTDERKN